MKLGFLVGNGHLIGNTIAFLKNGVTVESHKYAQHPTDIEASFNRYEVTVANNIDFDTIQFTGSTYQYLRVSFLVLNESTGAWVDPNSGNYLIPVNDNYPGGQYQTTAVFTQSSSAFTALIPAFPQLSLTLTEQIAAVDFIARAYSVLTGELVSEKTVQAGPFTLSLPNARPVAVVVMPVQGDGWKEATYYAINVLVFPKNPITTPYYYKRLSAGTSSATTEPTWSLVEGGQCNDGEVTNAWELVAGFSQPVVHSPLVATV